ncbi:hypothetical protein KY290_007935 [Solanum tuberosum]|uniref:Uncharacterized protein n=1 Tax=Solanum tuberosum TaxID=4113 RepID=A0ABQ7W709_SOLTU|nr:hypothetical protein KY290_007935 [Solanum tuberosum]
MFCLPGNYILCYRFRQRPGCSYNRGDVSNDDRQDPLDPTLFSSSSSLLCPPSPARTREDVALLSSPSLFLHSPVALLRPLYTSSSSSSEAAALPLLSSAASPVKSSSDRRATKNQRLRTAAAGDNNQQQP